MNHIICFHNPDEENGYLSNWYLSSFTLDGIVFSSLKPMMWPESRSLEGACQDMMRTIGTACGRFLSMRDCLQSFRKIQS